MPEESKAPTALPEIRSLWDFGDPAGSEARFRELIPLAAAQKNRGYHAELLTQAARAQGLQRQFDAAHRTLDEADALLTPDLERARVRYLLERGRVLNSSQERPASRPLFLQAWELAKGSGEHNLAVDAAHMLGIVEDPEHALEWNHTAIDYAEHAPDPAARGWLGPLYNNTGWTYFDRGEYDRALELLERALEWYVERGGPAQVRLAKYSVARTHRMLGRVEEALATQTVLLTELEADEKDGYISEEIAECLLALGREDEAKPHFLQAYRLLSVDVWLADSEPDRLARLKELSQ